MNISRIKRQRLAKDIFDIRQLEQSLNDYILQGESEKVDEITKSLLFAYRYLADDFANILVLQDEPV